MTMLLCCTCTVRRVRPNIICYYSVDVVGTAVGKLLTLGGVGIWWIVDIILLVLGELRPADDSNWVPYYWPLLTTHYWLTPAVIQLQLLNTDPSVLMYLWTCNERSKPSSWRCTKSVVTQYLASLIQSRHVADQPGCRSLRSADTSGRLIVPPDFAIYLT